MNTVIHIIYMVASVLFIMGIKQLAEVKTARRANALSAIGMALAMIGALLQIYHMDSMHGMGIVWIVAGIIAGSAIGAWLALSVKMEGMPELVGFFNGMGGLASSLVAVSMTVVLWGSLGGMMVEETTAEVTKGFFGADQIITVILSILVGGVTLTGSLVAWAKLSGKMSGGQIFLPAHQLINYGLLAGILVLGAMAFFAVGLDNTFLLYLLLGVAVLASFILGITFAIPVGGADMPVVISLLNSFSGIAAAMSGFVIQNNVLIISGSLVGAAGMILTLIMCRGMNRSLTNVLFAKFSETGGGGEEYKNVKSGDPVDAAIAMANASSVIIVPGYGMAAGQAQHAVRELSDLLAERGVDVRFGIHEVAGRMPGHMNVLLAEANVPYDRLYKREDIEAEFKNTNVVLVIGANDVVNPVAQDEEKQSPLKGMPILPCHEAQQVFVIKRSLGSGFAGIKNTLFEADNTLMVFGSAKDVVNGIIEEIKNQ